MNELYIIGLVVFGIIGLFIGVKYAVSKGKITPEIASNIDKSADKVIEVVQVFGNVLNFDVKTKKSIQTVLDIVDSVTDYVHDISINGVESVELSKKSVSEILTKLGISPTESEQRLIDIVIEESLRYFEKK